MPSTRSTRSSSNPDEEVTKAAILLDVVVEHVVEQLVRRQRIGVQLAWAKLALGGLLMHDSGIGGISARSSADLLRHRASHTSVFETSLSGAKPPTASPYSVEYPTASSLLLPVAVRDDRPGSTAPSAWCHVPGPAGFPRPARRSQCCSGTPPPSARWRWCWQAAAVGRGQLRRHGNGSWSSCWASRRRTPRRDRARRRRAAVTAESIPPDRPSTTERKPFLRT